jgi:hypothetical protein
MSSINYIKELKKVRLPKRIAAVGTAGLIVGAFAGAPAAPAAQNYAPQCDATATFVLQGLKVDYNLVCTDYSESNTIDTSGDSNQGTWSAKSYAEGDYVKYSNKWYRAAIAATSADEPTKPRTEDSELINVWTELSTDTAVAWSATSTGITATAGAFPAGSVVTNKVSDVVHYFKANAAAVAADVPGVSSKWDDLGAYAATWSAGSYASGSIVFKDDKFWKATSAAVAGDVPGTASNWQDKGAQISSPTLPLPYTGPQPAGSKVLTVKYPALVSGYSVIVLNNGVDGFDTEPAILKADKSGPAINQTQFCNGDHPGAGVSCSLQSAVNLYGQLNSDSSYTQLTGKTIAIKNADNTYSDLKSTNLYGDNSLTGSPTKTSASTDFFNLGALGNTTNAGKMIMPALSGSNITGELEISDNPCYWGGSVQMVALTADPEGQMNTPITFELPKSKYFRIIKLKDGSRETQEIPAGCTFAYTSTSDKVYSYDNDLKIVALTRPAKGSATRILAVQ